MQHIYPDTLHSLVQDGSAQIVDVRSPLEFANGHVPGARNVPVDRLTPADLAGLDPSRPVQFICKSGGRSQMAIFRLAAEGLQGDFVNVAGGTDAWIAMGFPIERG